MGHITRTPVELGFASDKVLGIFRTIVPVKELKVLQGRDGAGFSSNPKK